MIKVYKYMTSDGKLHDTVADAKHHADKRFGDAVHKLSSKLLRCDKAPAMWNAIESSLDEMADLLKLRDDLQLIEADDE